MAFVKAEKSKSKLRLAISGPSGSGKTYSALRMATGMGGRIALIDTEQESASLYADKFSFDRATLDAPYTPERCAELIKEAEQSKNYDILIFDSITHEWNGIGGCLEALNIISRTKYKGNSYMAWNEITPRHRMFIDTMLQSPLHIIATMRSKTAYVEVNKGERKTYQKQGVEPEQRDGIEFEFTVVLDVNNDGNFATASKDRTGLFSEPCVITEKTGENLIKWLTTGVDKNKMPENSLKDMLIEIQNSPDINSLP